MSKTPKNYCNCPQCQTVDCPAGRELAEARAALQVAHTWIAGRTQEFASSNFTDRYGYADSGKKVLAAIDAARRGHGQG